MYSHAMLTLAFGITLLVPFSAAKGQESPPPVVIVSGLASRQVAADSAEVRVAWYLTSEDAESQAREDSEAVASLRNLLGGAGAPSALIRFAPAPWYAPMQEDLPGRPRERRREVVTTVVGEQAVVEVLAALRNHRVFEEAGTEYGCSCADSARTGLLREAFSQSRARAAALAEASGTRLEGVVAMSTAPLDMQMLRGFQSVPLDGSGLESYGMPLVPPRLPDSGGLSAPLVTITAVVNVAWEVGRQGPTRE